jgi:alpha-tubulin suppressor-like RCC1 family protein
MPDTSHTAFVTPKVSLVPIDVGDGVAISVGMDAACAVRATGDVACWGDNKLGELGDGTRLSRAHPAAVVGLHDARAIAVGFEWACAVRAGGGVACWGRTDRGAVGTYATEWIDSPVAVTW